MLAQEDKGYNPAEEFISGELMQSEAIEPPFYLSGYFIGLISGLGIAAFIISVLNLVLLMVIII